MAEYWKSRPSAIATASSASRNQKTALASGARRTISGFDKHHEILLSNDAEEGWASELRHYLSMMQWDVEKDTDIIEWWQVSNLSYNLIID